MSIQTEITRLNTAKTNILESLSNKGVDISSVGTLNDIPEKIDGISVGITPTGNINITSTASTNVTNYATAKVVDSDLVAGNIKKGINILGITGTYDNQKTEQTKSVTITSNGTTTITPDSGKVLSSVSVTTNITYKDGNEVSY